MQRFTVPSREELSHPNRLIFDKLEQGLGMVPNLNAYFGHSESALANYLAFQQGQSKGIFMPGKEKPFFWPYLKLMDAIIVKVPILTSANLMGSVKKRSSIYV